LKALRKEKYTIFIDETTDIGNKSMANVYAMFDDGSKVAEHYVRVINMNIAMGLTARNFYDSTQELLRKKGVSLSECMFSELDGCNTNQGRHGGLRLYFCFENPHHISESCSSHKLALLSQKLVVEGPLEALSDADNLAVQLAVFFKGSSVRTAVFEHTQTVMENRALKLIIPSPTRWLTHGTCFKRLIRVFSSILESLNSIYVEKKDLKALGFLLAMIEPTFLLSCLVLNDVFLVMRKLTLWLQTSPSSADITKVPILVRETVNKLLYLSGEVSKEDSLTHDEREVCMTSFNRTCFIVHYYQRT
jgi:hypothetical protein